MHTLIHIIYFTRSYYLVKVTDDNRRWLGINVTLAETTYVAFTKYIYSFAKILSSKNIILLFFCYFVALFLWGPHVGGYFDIVNMLALSKC